MAALDGYSVCLKIKTARRSKFGDYRPLRGKRWEHQITMNNDLNPYAFLITMLHEIAHMYNFARHKTKVKPHGEEWKQYYAGLLKPFMERNVFPADIHDQLKKHINGITASSCTDQHLFRVLKAYDEESSGLILLENLPLGEHFKWRNGQVFQKVKKLRTRYRCVDVRSKRIWFFHPMAEVEKHDL